MLLAVNVQIQAEGHPYICKRMNVMSTKYKKTVYACFIGYIVQAIVNNFAPLLFVTFQTTYQIPLAKIALLIAANFTIQLLIDLLSVGFIDKIGYRASVVTAHIFTVIGLCLLAVLPELFADAFTGILTAVIIYGIGGGLLEVLLSPILEACPTDHKEKAMSLLHSFYCWGHMGVVLMSTLFFALFGLKNWKVLIVLWALIPAVNTVLFLKVPIYSLQEEHEGSLSLKTLCTRKIFWVMMLMMLGAGASEQAVSQWASAFAEQGLGISKTVGDLAGPMAFAMLMGLARLIYGTYGERIDLNRFIKGSCLLCIASYAGTALIPHPAAGLLGCALCGFSVGILWPGTFSKASALIKGGGTALFALLALAGDLGCAAGPALAGAVSGCFGNDLHAVILAAMIFPVLTLVGAVMAGRRSVCLLPLRCVHVGTDESAGYQNLIKKKIRGKS